MAAARGLPSARRLRGERQGADAVLSQDVPEGRAQRLRFFAFEDQEAHVSVAKGEATCEGQNVDLARRVGIVKVDVEPHALRFGIQDLRGPAAAVRGARRLVLVLEKGSAQGPKLALVRTSKE